MRSTIRDTSQVLSISLKFKVICELLMKQKNLANAKIKCNLFHTNVHNQSQERNVFDSPRRKWSRANNSTQPICVMMMTTMTMKKMTNHLRLMVLGLELLYSHILTVIRWCCWSSVRRSRYCSWVMLVPSHLNGCHSNELDSQIQAGRRFHWLDQRCHRTMMHLVVQTLYLEYSEYRLNANFQFPARMQTQSDENGYKITNHV